MRKSIIVLAVFLISGAVSLYGKKISHIIAEKPKNKTVCFLVSAGTDYSTSINKKSKAEVILSICRFHDGKKEIVWQGVVNNGSVKNYPSCSKPLYREVCVYNVYDSRETLAAYYQVVYNAKGSKMSYEQGFTLSQGSRADSLQVLI